MIVAIKKIEVIILKWDENIWKGNRLAWAKLKLFRLKIYLTEFPIRTLSMLIVDNCTYNLFSLLNLHRKTDTS